MGYALLANNASTTLSAAISSTGATTFSVVGAAAFPAVTTASGNYFYCTLVDVANIPEIVKVTNISGATFTCTRGQDGSAARTFASGATVSLRLVAAVFGEIRDALASAGGATTPVVVVTAASVTALAGTHYVLTNVAASTVALPANPAPGDTVWVTGANTLATNLIARSGRSIMGVGEDMVIDSAIATVSLRFVNDSWRLV